jgi:hypothetical protein
MSLNEETHGASFVNFSVYGRGAKGLSMIGMLLGLTRILFTIAHTSGSPNWTEAQVSCCGQILHRAGVNITR